MTARVPNLCSQIEGHRRRIHGDEERRQSEGERKIEHSIVYHGLATTNRIVGASDITDLGLRRTFAAGITSASKNS